MKLIDLKKEIEDKYSISLELEDWSYFDFPLIDEDVGIKINEDSVDVSIVLEFCYRDDLDTDKVLDWLEQNIRFYLYEGEFILTKHFDESDDFSLETIENWIQKASDRGI